MLFWAQGSKHPKLHKNQAEIPNVPMYSWGTRKIARSSHKLACAKTILQPSTVFDAPRLESHARGLNCQSSLKLSWVLGYWGYVLFWSIQQCGDSTVAHKSARMRKLSGTRQPPQSAAMRLVCCHPFQQRFIWETGENGFHAFGAIVSIPSNS